jgi:hypothetical protein
MEPIETIVIERSRVKMAGMFVISAVFVSLGIWFWLKPDDVVTPWLPQRNMVRMVGVISVVFFGGCGLYILKKLGDVRPAVIISEEGITDHSHASSPGVISWEDIADVREHVVGKHRGVAIVVKDAQAYIDREPNTLRRRSMKANYQLTGAITVISAVGLQCHYHQLKTLIEDGFRTYKQR